MGDLGRLLIISGLVIFAAGCVLLIASKFGLGRLPGDFVWQKGEFRIYLPLATCLFLSVVLTIILRMFRK